MGRARDCATASAKSQRGSGTALPASGTVFVSVLEGDKGHILCAMRDLVAAGWVCPSA